MLDTLRVLAEHTSGPEDTVLLHPLFVQARGRRIAVFDRGRAAIEVFGLDGELLWTAGQEGSGPEEFRQVTSIGLTDDGAVYALDRGNGRLARVSPSGRFLEPIHLTDSLALFDRLVVRPSGTIALFRQTDPVLLEITKAGDLRRSAAHPWAEFQRHPRLATYYLPVPLPNREIALVQYYGGGFAVLDSALDGRLPLMPFVEHIALPEVIVEAAGNRRIESLASPTLAIRNATATTSHLAVLAAGRTHYAGRVLDLYELATGRYHGSWLLPHVVRYVAALGDTLVAVRLDPDPALVLYDLPDASR
jgi:hypothetical protein